MWVCVLAVSRNDRLTKLPRVTKLHRTLHTSSLLTSYLERQATFYDPGFDYEQVERLVLTLSNTAFGFDIIYRVMQEHMRTCYPPLK